MTYIAMVDKFIPKKMGKGARDHLGESSALTVIGMHKFHIIFEWKISMHFQHDFLF